MVDITVKLSNISEDDVDNIVASCENLSDETTINITKPWPKLEFGDRFVYAGEVFGFLSYVSDDKVRCIAMETMVSTDTYLQVVYFDCTRRRAEMKFIIRSEEK